MSATDIARLDQIYREIQRLQQEQGEITRRMAAEDQSSNGLLLRWHIVFNGSEATYMADFSEGTVCVRRHLWNDDRWVWKMVSGGWRDRSGSAGYANVKGMFDTWAEAAHDFEEYLKVAVSK